MSAQVHTPHAVCGHPRPSWWRYTAPGQPQRVSCELCGCDDVAACPSWEPTDDDRRDMAGDRPAGCVTCGRRGQLLDVATMECTDCRPLAGTDDGGN